MRHLLASAAFVAGLALGTGGPALAAGSGKALVELFTSQGCYNCPPADAYLVELAERGTVVVLSQHVDYWNYIGWSDPFSRADATERQQTYRRALNSRYVYTPQMVIDGIVEVIGSDRPAVEKHLAAMALRERVEFQVARDGARAKVRIPGGQALYGGSVVWAIDYDLRHTTKVERGENKGHSVTNANVVREMRRVGRYSGEAALEIPLDLAKLRAAGRSGCIIVVQALGTLRVYGAIQVPVDEGS